MRDRTAQQVSSSRTAESQQRRLGLSYREARTLKHDFAVADRPWELVNVSDQLPELGRLEDATGLSEVGYTAYDSQSRQQVDFAEKREDGEDGLLHCHLTGDHEPFSRSFAVGDYVAFISDSFPGVK